MKTLRIALAAFSCSLITLAAHSQTVSGVSDIGTGYFNGHVYATYSGNVTGTPPSINGDLAGNNFTIAFSNNSRNILATYANYAPNTPANSGISNSTNININYTSVPAISTVTFNTNLQPLDQLIVVDIDYSEAATFSFLDVSGNDLPLAGNIKLLSLSNIVTNVANIQYLNTTTIGINTAAGYATGNNTDQGFSFVVLSNLVRAVRITQTRTSGGGSWTFTFSKGSGDQGDAPLSYGTPLHLPINRLKLGTVAPDAEASGVNNATATGDNMVSGSTIVNDEEGVTSLPAIVNDGTSGQIISSYSINYNAFNSTGSSAKVVAWIDWNGNGVFEPSEGILDAPLSSTATSESRTLTWNNVVLTGDAGRTGTYLRMRVSTGDLSTATPDGFMPDGEVEDYFIPFTTVLPVSLTAFTAIPQRNATILLQWKTQTEQNNNGFEVLKKQETDDWTNVGFVNSLSSTGNSNTTLLYNFTDNKPFSGTSYYRLKQVDFDGKSKYSHVVRVVMNDTNGDILKVYPNPASNWFVAEVRDAKNTKLSVVGNNGTFFNLPIQTTGNTMKVDCSVLTNGVYYLLLETATRSSKYSILIRK